MILLHPSTTRIERCEVDPTVTFVGWVNAYDSTFASGCHIGPFTEVGGAKIGKNSRIGSNCFICPGVEIGEETFISHGVVTTNDLFSDVPEYNSLEELRELWKSHKTVIGSRVRIGSGAVILPCTIGDGAIIGAGCVVVRDVPAGATVMGVPGRVTSENSEREWRFS